MVWPPLGLWYIAAQLEAQGHHTDFIDMSANDTLPNDGEYDQMWISAKSPQIFEIKKIAEHTKDWTKTRTVLGGAAAWVNPETYRSMFDLVVCGEGDHPDTIFDITNPTFNGIYYPALRPNLDWVLPPLRRWALDYHSYMTSQDGNKYRMASLFTTRGCPMSCAFCSSGRLGTIWGNRTRYEPLHIVEHQIKECLDLGFTGIAFSPHTWG